MRGTDMGKWSYGVAGDAVEAESEKGKAGSGKGAQSET